MTRAAAVLLSLALCAIVASSIRPGIIGLFHDDGLYAVVGKSVSEGRGYRITSLPSAPLETKYPVAYPTLLAAGWRIAGGFPAVIVWLKGLNVVCLFVALLGAWRLFERATGTAGLAALAFTMLVGTDIAIVSYVDMTMTETLFLALAIWAMALHSDGAGDRPGPNVVWLPALIVALACLTRQPGVALAIAGLLHVAAGRDRRRVLVYVGIIVALVSPWMVWRSLAGETVGVLEAYYTAYERSALLTAFADPAHAAQIVRDNVVYLAASIDADLRLPLLPGLRWFVYPLMVVGALRGHLRTRVFVTAFVVVYVAGVVSHPFHPHRYVVPLVPVVLLWLLQGATTVSHLVPRGARRPVWRGAVGLLVAAPVVLMLMLNLLWLSRFVPPSKDGLVRGWQGGTFSYSWEGFTETFEWIRNHTREDDVIGSGYDPMYYLYTGRRGVRPWIHQPETYFYPREHPRAELGDPALVRRELERLGVRYLVLDPLDGYAEARAAPEYWKSLLAAYPVAPVQVFVSRDGKHVVYALPPAPAK